MEYYSFTYALRGKCLKFLFIPQFSEHLESTFQDQVLGTKSREAKAGELHMCRARSAFCRRSGSLQCRGLWGTELKGKRYGKDSSRRHTFREGKRLRKSASVLSTCCMSDTVSGKLWVFHCPLVLCFDENCDSMMGREGGWRGDM